MLWPALFGVGVFTAVFSPAKGFAAEELLDRIVAVVNGEPVLYSQVKRKVDQGPLISVSFYPAKESDAPYEKALQDAINFELILQKAQELEIDPSDDEVEREMDKFLQRQNISRQVLMDQLAREGKTFEDYFADFRDFYTIRNFQGRVIMRLVKITDKDVETFYLKKMGAKSDLVELTLRQILIEVDGGAAPSFVEAKQKLAFEVHEKLQGGMKFEEAVKLYSDDPAARDNGGLMQSIRLRDLAGVIREAVGGLEVGKFSEPVRTQLGFHIFFLEEKEFVGGNEFQKLKQRLEAELMQFETLNQTAKWLAEQRQQSKVRIIE